MFYDPTLLNYNLHNLLHIGDCVKQFGHLNNFSAYIFENFLFNIKKRIRSPSNILTQIENQQKEIWEMENKNNQNQNMNNTTFKCNFKNSCFLLKNGIRISIIKLVQKDNKKWISCKRFTECRSLFDSPVNSEQILSIVISDGLENETLLIPDEDNRIKLVVLPDNGRYILLPLLHL